MDELRESRSRRVNFQLYSNRDLSDVEQISSLESISEYDNINRPSSVGASLRARGRRTAILKQTQSAVRVRDSLGDDGSLGDSDDEDSHGGGISFYARPAQRQRWGEDQVLPHVNWGDIFFDLFYVAAAYNLGSMLISSLSQDQSFRGVVYFIGIFGPLYFMWESKLVYESRYTVVDLAHRLLEVVRVFFISFAVLHIKTIDLMSDPSSAETLCFTVSLFLESLIPILLKTELILVGEGDREAIRNHSLRKIKNIFIPVSTLYLAAAIISIVQYVQVDEDDNYEIGKASKNVSIDHNPGVEDDGHMRLLAEASDSSSSYNDHSGWRFADLPIALCCIAYIFNLVYTYIRKMMLLSGTEDFRVCNVPTNIDFQIHRYGEWVLLMMGESVLSLLIVETTEKSDYYIVAVFGIITVFVLQALHFESEPSHAEAHALWRNLNAQLFYSYLIQLLSIGLIAFGASYKVMLKIIHQEDIEKEKTDKGTDYEHRNLAGAVTVEYKAMACVFCASLALVLLTLEFMTLTHGGQQELKKRLFGVGVSVKSKKRLPIILMSILKVCMLVFIILMPLWVTRPRTVVIIGFVIVSSFGLMRVIGWNIYHKKHEIFFRKSAHALAEAPDGAKSVSVSKELSNNTTNETVTGNDQTETGNGSTQDA